MVDIFALLCQYSVHNYPFTVNTDWQSKKCDSFTVKNVIHLDCSTGTAKVCNEQYNFRPEKLEVIIHMQFPIAFCLLMGGQKKCHWTLYSNKHYMCLASFTIFRCMHTSL